MLAASLVTGSRGSNGLVEVTRFNFECEWPGRSG